MRVSTVDPAKKTRAKELLQKALQSVKMKVIAEGSGVPYGTLANFQAVNSIGEEKLEALLKWLEAYHSGEGPVAPVEVPVAVVEPVVEAPVDVPVAPVETVVETPDPNEPDKDYANETGGMFYGNEWLENCNAMNRLLNCILKGYDANKDLPGYPRKEVEGYLKARADYREYQKKVLTKKGLTK